MKKISTGELGQEYMRLEGNSYNKALSDAQDKIKELSDNHKEV